MEEKKFESPEEYDEYQRSQAELEKQIYQEMKEYTKQERLKSMHNRNYKGSKFHN